MHTVQKELLLVFDIVLAYWGVALWPLQELALLRSQMGGQVNVSVNASPSIDLNQVMTEIREHYEGLIAKNRKELEMWYQNKVRSYNFCKLILRVKQ